MICLYHCNLGIKEGNLPAMMTLYVWCTCGVCVVYVWCTGNDDIEAPLLHFLTHRVQYLQTVLLSHLIHVGS